MLVAAGPAAQARLDHGPDQLGRVIDVQRAGAVVGDQVGDIDQGVDRTQADGRQAVGCSHAGEGPFLTPLIRRPAERGAGVAVDLDLDRAGEGPGTGAIDRSFSVPRPAAARSRAMPATPSQSGRLGVTSKSITASRPRAVAAGVPTARSFDSSRMPSSRRRRSPAPSPSTACRWRPRRAPASRPGSRPGRAHRRRSGRRWWSGPARALGAPQTISLRPSTVSTWQTRRLSALGCCTASTILATVKAASLEPGSVDVLDLEAGHGHGVDDLIDRGGGLEVLLEPGEGELHCSAPSPATDRGRSGPGEPRPSGTRS